MVGRPGLDRGGQAWVVAGKPMTWRAGLGLGGQAWVMVGSLGRGG